MSATGEIPDSTATVTTADASTPRVGARVYMEQLAPMLGVLRSVTVA